MREKGEILRDVTDLTKARRKVQPLGAIKEDCIVEAHRARARTAKARNQFQERSFSCSRGTEDSSEREMECGVDLESETGQLQSNTMKPQVHRRYLRREISCPQETVMKTMPVETKRRGKAAAS